MPKVIGSSMVMVAIGPTPGSTPISVPIRQPRKHRPRFFSDSATLNPRPRLPARSARPPPKWLNMSISAPPQNEPQPSGRIGIGRRSRNLNMPTQTAVRTTVKISDLDRPGVAIGQRGDEHGKRAGNGKPELRNGDLQAAERQRRAADRHREQQHGAEHEERPAQMPSLQSGADRQEAGDHQAHAEHPHQHRDGPRHQGRADAGQLAEAQAERAVDPDQGDDNEQQPGSRNRVVT